MTIKTVVMKIKRIKEGKVTNLRRNCALEAHADEVKGSYSLSSTDTGDPYPIAEAFSFSLITPQNIVGVNFDLRLEGQQS